MSFRIVLLMLILGALSSYSIASTSALPGQDNELPLDHGLRSGKLANGLTYYIKPDSSVERTHVELIVNAGYGEQTKDQNGLAHLLEHLAFSWSADYPNDRWRAFIAKAGIDPSVGTNYGGQTGQVTRYWVRVPGAGDAMLGETFGLLRSWLDGMVITQNRMDRERPVVLSEVRSNDNNHQFTVEREMMYRLLDSPAYDVNFRKVHDDNIETATLASLQHFYDDWYRPDLAAVIVVGPVDVTKAEQLLRAEFGQVKPKPLAPLKMDTDLPLKVELTGRSQYLTRFDARLPGVKYTIYRKRPSRSHGLKSEGDVRQEIVDDLVNRLVRARIEDAVSIGDIGCAASATLRPFWTPLTRIDALESAIACKDGSGALEALQQFQLALDQMMAYGFTAEEVGRVKGAVREGSQPGSSNQAKEVAVLAENFLHRQPVIDLTKLAAVKEGVLAAITPQEIVERLRYFEDPSRDCDIVVTSNERFQGQTLGKTQLEAILAARRGKDVPRFIPAEPPLEIFEPARRDLLLPSRIAADRWIDELGARKITLANGSILYFLVKEDGAADGRVSIAGFRRTGCGTQARAICEDVSLVAGSAGFSDLSSRQVSLFKKSNELSSSIFVESGHSTITTTARSGDLEEALQLVLLTLTDLRPDEAAYSRLKRERFYDEPDQGYVAAIDRKLQLEPSYAPAKLGPETISLAGRSDFKRAVSMFDQLLRGKGGFTFVISGSIDLDKAIPLAARYLGALPSSTSSNAQKASTSRNIPKSFITTPSRRWIELPPAIAATMSQKGYARIYSGGDYDDTLVNRIELELLGSALQQAMLETLRQNGGGVYSPSGGIELLRAQPGQTNGGYRVSIRFSADPGQLDRLVGVARNQLAELAKKGVPQAYVDRAIAQAKSTESTTLGSTSWARHLLESLARGEDPTEILKRQSLVSSVITKKTLDRAARRYLRTDNLRIILISPKQPSQ